MMVIAMMMPAITQPTAIHRPPKTIHSTFSSRERRDMVAFHLRNEGSQSELRTQAM